MQEKHLAVALTCCVAILGAATAAGQDPVTQNPAGVRIQTQQSTVRQTPNTDFGSVLKAGVAVRVDSLSGGVSILDELIARPEPTAGSRAELAAWNDQTAWLKSVRNRYQTLAEAYAAAGGTSDSAAAGIAAPFVPGGAVVSAAVSSSRGSARTGGGDAQAASSSVASNTDPMAELDAQFLALQEAVQMENRRFQTLSNASKARHDVAMNAIRNMK